MTELIQLKKIFSNKLKNHEEICSICKDSSKMFSSGFLLKYNDSNYWVIEFKCEKDGEIIEKWNIKYETIIQEVLKDKKII